jgi:hypothetical protein
MPDFISSERSKENVQHVQSVDINGQVGRVVVRNCRLLGQSQRLSHIAD